MLPVWKLEAWAPSFCREEKWLLHPSSIPDDLNILEWMQTPPQGPSSNPCTRRPRATSQAPVLQPDLVWPNLKMPHLLPMPQLDDGSVSYHASSCGCFSVSEELASCYILETSLQLNGVTVVAIIPMSQMGLPRLREGRSCSSGLDPCRGGFTHGGLPAAPQSFPPTPGPGNSADHCTCVRVISWGV